LHLGEAIEEKRARRKEKKHRNRKRPAAIGLSGSEKQVMASHSYFHSKAILKISQSKGLRDPKWGCTFESFGFIKAVEHH